MQKRKTNNKSRSRFADTASSGPKEPTKRGRVVEALPNAQFKVEYEDGTKGIAYLGGKMKVYKIRVLVGDMVDAVVDPYSKKGRIVKRG